MRATEPLSLVTLLHVGSCLKRFVGAEKLWNVTVEFVAVENSNTCTGVSEVTEKRKMLLEFWNFFLSNKHNTLEPDVP